MQISYRKKFLFFLFSLSGLLFIFFIFGLVWGTIPIQFHQLFHLSFFYHNDVNFIIALRLNREILAICCGGMLAMGSAILQGITRNPMIAPDLTGMTSMGCLLIVVCEIYFIKSNVLNIVLGSIGALWAFFLCFLLTKNNNNRLTIVLTGVSISLVATAIMQILILHSPETMTNHLQFLTGCLYAITTNAVTIILIMTLILVPITLLLSKRFILFSFDETACISMGLTIKHFKNICLLTAAFLIGASITGMGNMGFLGIVSPNIARLLIGNRPTYTFPLSFLLGGLIYLISDIIGRCIISPAEIPAGIICNMLTAPLFLFILLRSSRTLYEWN